MTGAERSLQLPASASAEHGQMVAVGALLVVIGLVLRVVSAGGDLWLDEIASLDNLKPLTSIDQVFWRINHDNNHFLTSAYLYLIGPDVPVVVQRALSIALGTASIAAAIWATAGRGFWTQVVTGLLFAVSYAMVHFGSEARGYVGIVLFTLLAIPLLERLIDGGGSRLALAGLVLLGCLSHLTMIEPVVALGLWAFGFIWWRDGQPVRAVITALNLFAPTIIAVLLMIAGVALCIAIFGLAVGGYTPFSLMAFATGYGGLLKALLGLPQALDDGSVIAVVTCVAGVALWVCRDRRIFLYLVGIVAWPVIALVLQLPNLEFPRYFIGSGVFVLLLIGELMGRAFAAGFMARSVAAIALVALLVGNGIAMVRFLEEKRGTYQAYVAEVAATTPATYGTNHEPRTEIAVNHFAQRLGRRVELIARDQWCAKPPQWFIVELQPDSPERLEPTQDCHLSYRRVAASVPQGLSGIAWTLYRRSE